ncbi:MAG: arginine deiminase family protein [Fimbriimonadaceae bacterium]
MPQFSRAIVRPPCSSFAQGLTTSSFGAPDFEIALVQHAEYVATLQALGLVVTELPPEDAYPDSTFVEDVAIAIPAGFILSNPGAAERKGEVALIEPQLAPVVGRIEAPGTLDGGDVCQMGQTFLIGISARTNEEGARQLTDILQAQGFEAKTVDIRKSKTLLHLKSGLTFIDESLVIAHRELAQHDALSLFEVVSPDADNAYAANAIAINGKLLFAAGHEKLETKLRVRGCDVLPLEMSEFQKMDGGLSCLSLRY